LLILTTFLTSCAGVKKLEIFKEEVPRAQLNLEKPTPLELENLRWIIITSENAEEVFKKLEEQGIVSLDTKLSEILPYYKNSNKKNMTIKKMLSHYAQLKPWIPFYYATLDSITKKPSSHYYSTTSKPGFTTEVAPHLFMRDDYQDSIPKIIKDTDLLNRLRYRYSDLPYYIIKQYIEKHYNKTLDEVAQDRFYRSLGANHTLYNPYKTISNTKIPPTEEDDYYRFQKVQGYVHDMGAAMQGGVGGHAGVFSNANDIAKIMQLYLQKGFYGGVRYLKSGTLLLKV